MNETTSAPEENKPSTAQSGLSGFIAAAGVILAVSYPVLAISTGFRAVYQIIEGDPGNAAYLSLLAAMLYATATIGFVVRKRWAWRLSVTVLLFESLMTLLIGTLSFVEPELFGRNVWQFFGRDYGYFPLVQPILGLLWLFNPQTLVAYGIKMAKVQVERAD